MSSPTTPKILPADFLVCDVIHLSPVLSASSFKRPQNRRCSRRMICQCPGCHGCEHFITHWATYQCAVCFRNCPA
ncbi:hypothetical protein HZ326_9495 [Fusarium oxysporum f. sp. albedinis]|nr:hypothetical protein HZ326_9495 [Fusarium oxysporum f. sp. albedinis]